MTATDPWWGERSVRNCRQHVLVCWEGDEEGEGDQPLADGEVSHYLDIDTLSSIVRYEVNRQCQSFDH